MPSDFERTVPHAGTTVAYRSFPKLLWRDADGEHVTVLDRTMVVGSSDKAHVQIADRKVSRLHCELEPKEDGIWVRDLGSRNSTRIDGVMIQVGRAVHDSVIRVASVEIRVDFEHAEKRAVSSWSGDRFGQLVGGAPVMRELFAQLHRVCPSDAPVLIRGETGTGKELIARAIHDGSPRARAPFLIVDCAALPENLLEAELYGHARGAFTGALNARPGVFEAAEGGTVFLDEIGEVPLQLQPKLLRVLESKLVRRLGESEHRKVDVRFVAATHRDLLEMVNRGTFREDLYFRLSVLPVHVPPLRERADDIPLLARAMLPAASHAMLTPEIERRLMSIPWRGNVRELRNFLDRATALGIEAALNAMQAERTVGATESQPSIPPPAASAMELPPDGTVEAPAPESLDDAIYDLVYKDFRERWLEYGEREYIRRRLTKHAHNVSAVAREVELARQYIYRLMKKHDL